MSNERLGLIGCAEKHRCATDASRSSRDRLPADVEHSAPDAGLLAVGGPLVLRPRLGRPCDRTDKTPPWGIPLLGTGLEINLVVDCPHGMVYVTGPMLARSRKKGEDLLDVALENLRTATPADYFERASDELDIYIGHAGDGSVVAFIPDVEAEHPGAAAAEGIAVDSSGNIYAAGPKGIKKYARQP